METTLAKHKGRTVGAVGAAALAGMLGLGAVAYACSAQAVITPSRTSAPAGATVTGSGSAFSKTLVQPGTPVNIRWNSTSATPLWSGPSDANGRISFSITIPAVANGHYSLVATQGTMVGRAPFEVVAPSSTGTGSGSTGSGDTDTSQTTQGTQGDTSGETSQSTNTATNTATDNGSSPDSSGTDQAQGEAGQSASTATSSETSQSRPATETATITASPPVARSAATSSAPAPAPASSAPAPASSPAAPPPAAAEVTEATPAPAVAEPAPVASATGDLWSGFDTGDTPSLMPAEADSPSSTGSFTAGLALLATGMVALFGGLFVTVARRRKVLAET